MKKDLNKTKEQLFSELNDLHKKSKEREEIQEAAKQQLLATEQQLRASNQQLEASEEKYQVLSDNIKIGLVLHNANTEIIFSNPAASNILGLTKEQMLGKKAIDPAWQFCGEDGSVLPLAEYPVNIVIDSNKSINDYIIGINVPDRDFITWISVNATLVFDNKKSLSNVTITFSDITERKKAEEKVKAANQQLAANEQQLWAANQQLKASEEKLLEAQYLTKMGDFTWNIQTAEVSWSDGMHKLLKYDKIKEIDYAKVNRDIHHPDDLERVTKWLMDSIASGNKKLEPNEYRLVCKNGEIKYVQTIGTIEYKNGEAVQLFGTCQDITERKQAEEKLKGSEEKFRNIFENKGTATGIFDDDGIIKDCNSNFEELSGYSKTEIIDKMKWSDFVDKEDLERMKKYHSQRLQEGSSPPSQYECAIIKKNGEIISVIVNIALTETERIVSLIDVTERKQRERELSKLSTAIEQSPSIIVTTDPQGNIEYANPKFTQKTGYTLEEVKGQEINNLRSGDMPEEVYDKLWDTISSGKEWQGEFHNKKKNGELYWESASVSPIFDEQGKIINYIKVAEDISMRKRNEQIQKIIHNISNATNTIHNIDEFIEFIREELGSIIDTENFYVTLYDNKTKTISLLYHQDQKDKLEKFPHGKTLTNYVIKTKKTLLATKAVKDKLVKSGELELLGNDSKVWLGIPLMIKKAVIGAFAVQSYTDENAFGKTDMQVLEIISNQISISLERKKAEEDLKSARDKAQESDRLKSAFLANMSHEIRTPMNGILGFTNLLMKPELSGDKQNEYINIIQKSGYRMLNTINDIIDISKIEAGQIEVVKSEVSVNKILKEQYEFFNQEVQSKGLELIYKPTLSDKEANIVTDKNKLEGIFTNLIKNAIKYTKNGNICFGCSLKKESNFDALEFYVKDTGIGIPSDRTDAIFYRFEQADIEDTRAFEGSGLGLAISKSYVEMLGGSIRVSSKEGSGSTFTFSIPYIQPSTKYGGIENNEKKEQKTSLTDVSIIIAEDDKNSQLFFKTIFENKFRNIFYTTSGEETIEAIKKHPETNIILMDIKIHGMSGYEATREIRKFNRNVIIIAQTAFGLAGDREKAIEAGCDDYISKPINEDQLFEKVMLHLSKKSI
jgi:PAS domain S-box-containing protein